MKKVMLIFLCLSFAFGVNVFPGATAHAEAISGNVYYVDPILGSDDNSGTSEDQAWKSLDKPNTTVFRPGDHLLFKAGGVWNGQLRPLGSGVEGQPIIIDRYGEGDKPIINGNGTIASAESGAVMLVDQEYWEINNLEVTNYSETVKSSRAGILIISNNSIKSHIYIRDTYVHDVNSDKDGSKVTGGIIIIGAGGFHDVLVENNHVKNVAIEGIRNANGLNKINTDIVFRNNYIEEVLGDGIVLTSMKSGGVVEHNVVKNFANTNVGNRNYAGIWVFAADNTIFQYNEVFGGKYGYNDGEAYDIDLYCNNTLFQYNYSHNNRGGFSLFMNGSTNSVFRYNVSVNDGSDAEIFYYGPSTAAEAPEIYNNTIITGQSSNTKIFNAWNANATMKFYNNIIYGGKNVKFSNFAAKGSFANNSVYPSHILDTNGPTTHPGLVTANPKISNPWVEVLGIENTNVYKLSSDSPLINAGKVISNNGGKDYFGNVLTDGLPDIGAHEYTNDPGPKPEPIPVTSVILNKTELTLIKGDSHTLNASVLPTTVYDKEVTWKSSDPSIIQVSQSGQVKALAPGHAVITATSNQDEAISTQCEITVTDTPEGLLFATEDAFVRDGSSANSNFGKEALLYIKNDAAGYARKAYMKFDLGSLSPKEIKSAKLRLYVDVADGNPNRTISLYKTSNSWSESAITWNNAPQAEGLLGTFPVANESLKNWITVDVTDFIHASKNEGLVSLLLKNEAAYSPTSGIANIQFGSRENDNRPQLFIEYEDETLPGANLLINGGFEFSSLSPAPWTYYNGVQIMSDQNVRTGNNALKFSNAISGLEQVVQGLTPNTNYVLKGWMKSTDVSNTQSLGVKNYGGVQVSKSVGSLEYSEAKLIFKTGATNTKATIYSYKGSNTGKLAYVDDITLEQYEKPAAENVTFTTKQNQAYVGNLNVTHADGETLTYTLLTAGEKGSVVINASTGSFTYTPDLGVIGTDVFTVKVNDGIADSEPITVTVDIVDGLPPVTTDNAASGWQQNVQTVYLDAKDNIAGAVQTFYSIDGAPFIEGNTIVIEQEGEHEIHYYSIDAAGNQEEVKSSIIKIDRTGPEIIPTAPLNVYQSDTVAISFQTTDQWSGVVEVTVILDGEVISNQTTLEPLALTLGEHIIQVIAGDEAGSETVREFTLNIMIDADRLDDVLMIGYNKGWITNAGILQSLLAKVEQIQENSENASNEFKALENHLRAQSGKHIEESFTQLLLDDIAFIKSMNR